MHDFIIAIRRGELVLLIVRRTRPSLKKLRRKLQKTMIVFISQPPDVATPSETELHNVTLEQVEVKQKKGKKRDENASPRCVCVSVAAAKAS